MSQLSHERIVQMFGACIATTRLGVVMRLATHGTAEHVLVVKKRFASNSLHDRRAVAQIIVDISAGMAFLHANTNAEGKAAPIVHRDCTSASFVLFFSGLIFAVCCVYAVALRNVLLNENHRVRTSSFSECLQPSHIMLYCFPSASGLAVCDLCTRTPPRFVSALILFRFGLS